MIYLSFTLNYAKKFYHIFAKTIKLSELFLLSNSSGAFLNQVLRRNQQEHIHTKYYHTDEKKNIVI